MASMRRELPGWTAAWQFSTDLSLQVLWGPAGRVSPLASAGAPRKN